MAWAFWGRGLEYSHEPGFGHLPRWKSTAALRRFFCAEFRQSVQSGEEAGIESLPTLFHRWDPLSQDQFLEIRTLFEPYVISSQGDRVMMAHGVEGRFPFLDPAVIDFSCQLPADYRLRSLDEKYVLKLAAKKLLPAEILRRKKQPFRAPDASSFLGGSRPDYLDLVMSEDAVKRNGIFEPSRVTALVKKLRRGLLEGESEPFSNADNMAFMGILSTQLLYEKLIRRSSTQNSEFQSEVGKSADRLELTAKG